jgi:hypothetical protein
VRQVDQPSRGCALHAHHGPLADGLIVGDTLPMRVGTTPARACASCLILVTPQLRIGYRNITPSKCRQFGRFVTRLFGHTLARRS